MAPNDQVKNKLSGTQLIHADDALHGPEVAPSISVSTSKFVADSLPRLVPILINPISLQGV